jgi:DNA replication protein DnaC
VTVSGPALPLTLTLTLTLPPPRALPLGIVVLQGDSMAEDRRPYTRPMADEPTYICMKCHDSGWRLIEGDRGECVTRCDCAVGTRREEFLEHAGLPGRYRECSLENFEVWNPEDPTLAIAHRTVREFVDLWPDVDRGLLLMGGVGTGKTHLAAAALQELISTKGVQGKFQDFTSLVLEIQMTFDRPGAQRELMRPLVATDLLVVDELGAGKVTPWVMDLLYYLVNSRYVEGRITLFTTNYSDFASTTQETLTDRVSARIRSRLFEMCRRVELRGTDYRKQRLAHQPGRG